MPDIEQKVLTSPTFINGSLQPAGAIVTVAAAQFVDEDGKPADLSDEKLFPNLADLGTAPVLMPTAVAAINPTGPAPTAPQQLAPGSMQTGVGTYVNGEAQLVAEGHPDFEEMVKGAEALNDGIEQEAITRLSQTQQDAGTAGSGTNGTETGSTGTGKPFTTDTYTGSTIEAADFSGLTPEQLAQVREAEVNGQNRAGMLAKIDAASA